MRCRLVGALFVVALAAAVPASAASQQRDPRMPAGRMTPAEVQGLFDAYALVQAQDALKLTDAQYGEFVSRMKALQETRRRHQRDRARILRDLAQDANSGRAEGLRDRLAALRDLDARAAGDLQKAYDALDAMLDLQQRARFRLFEDRMEQRKFDLLMRARQRQNRRQDLSIPQR